MYITNLKVCLLLAYFVHIWNFMRENVSNVKKRCEHDKSIPRHQTRLIFPSWWNLRQKVAVATLCVYFVVVKAQRGEGVDCGRRGVIQCMYDNWPLLCSSGILSVCEEVSKVVVLFFKVNCTTYTWFDTNNQLFSRYCFLFSSCTEVRAPL